MNIMIIGTTGTIGSAVRKQVLTNTNWKLTLLLRKANNSLEINPKRENIIVGDIASLSKETFVGVDAVFVAISGDMPFLTQKIVSILSQTQTKRLVQILTMGIYNEVPSRFLHGGGMSDYVKRYASAAEIIENSNLEYTIIRPGWFDYGTDEIVVTRKGEMVTGHDVSVPSVANFVLNVLSHPESSKRESFGINRPE